LHKHEIARGSFNIVTMKLFLRFCKQILCPIQLKFCVRIRLKPSKDQSEFEVY